MTVRLICILIGYVCGLFQTGYLYGRMHKVDIREHGSGNAGTTNALRTMGPKAGIVTLLGDAFKCVLAVVIVHLLFGKSYPEMATLLGMYAAMGAVLGHNYPFYLHFKGGKGIAATAGLILTTNPWMVLISLIVFVVTVAVTRYVSVGSLVLVVSFVIQLVAFGQSGAFGLAQNYLYEMYGIGVLLALSAFFMHRENIKRLMNGTENKFHLKNKNNE